MKMINRDNARANLKRFLLPFKVKTFAELELLLGSEVYQETVIEPGAQYKCTVKVDWADYPAGHNTVYGIADNFPRTVSEAFTISPDNKITSEESH